MRLLLLVLMVGLGVSARAAELVVDCAKEVGKVRPLQGVNGGPIEAQGLIDLTEYQRALRVPWVRLHDCNWPNPDVVDMHVVFPDLAKDPERGESYEFVRTDAYLKSVAGTGAGIVYRLGESIEHGADKRRGRPPADAARWAAACVGVVGHYNEGWAGGSRMGIRYWEIWNEPDNRPNCWGGTDEEYFRLYATVAKTIKARFPEVKVGGPAVGNAGTVAGGRFEATPFVRHFLEYCRREKAPLDFFSHHRYSADPGALVVQARGVREALDRAGFAKTESHLNEWNYLPDDEWRPVMREGQGAVRERFYRRVGGAEGAAFAACALIELQDAPVDVANYFSGNTQGFGLFDVYGSPKKNYFAFKAFEEMVAEAPVRLAASGGVAGKLAACAGRDAGGRAVDVLVANFRADDSEVRLDVRNLTWAGMAVVEELAVDAESDWRSVRRERWKVGQPIRLTMRAPAVRLVRIRNVAGG